MYTHSPGIEGHLPPWALPEGSPDRGLRRPPPPVLTKGGCSVSSRSFPLSSLRAFWN